MYHLDKYQRMKTKYTNIEQAQVAENSQIHVLTTFRWKQRLISRHHLKWGNT